MAIKAAWGFESGLVPANILPGSNTLTADTVIVRNGVYSLKLVAGSASTGASLPSQVMAATTDETIIGFGWHADSLVNSGNIIGINGGNGACIVLAYGNDGTLQVYTSATITGNSTLLGTSASVVTQDTWHYIVLRLKFHDTTGIVELWVDGLQVLDLTNVDTIHAGGTLRTVRQISLHKTAGSTPTWFDDIVVADSTGSDVTGVFDPVKIEALNPTSDVAENWTPSTGTDSYALVDERPVSATDYLASSVSTTKDEWGMSNRTHTGPILALVAHGVGVNTDGGAAALKLGLKRGGAESQSGALGLATTTSHVQWVVENDPTTGIAWTDANANAVTMTIEVA